MPPLHLLRREVVVSGADRYGRPLTSCVIEADTCTPEQRAADQKTALDRDTSAFDLRTLRMIADRPDMATSQDKLRMILGVRKGQVGDALTRLTDRGWALPGARSKPYTVTDTGRAALEASR